MAESMSLMGYLISLYCCPFSYREYIYFPYIGKEFVSNASKHHLPNVRKCCLYGAVFVLLPYVARQYAS